MMRFNICVTKPENYVHSYAFMELSELIYFSLKEIGFDVTFGFNRIESDARNIIIGCHLLDPKYMNEVPKSSIVLNTEQIYADKIEWNKNIFSWVQNFEVWDYNERNIEKLLSLGVENPKILKIGYQSQLAKIIKSETKDVDVLFYGSINERRKFIIDQLLLHGLKVKILFGVYGKERDDWIGRSHIVLNHHFYDSQIFEIVRVFYLMTNSVAVVGEVNDTTYIDEMCREGVYGAKYEDLVTACLHIVKNKAIRDKLANNGFNSIFKHPQKVYMLQMFEK